MNTNTECNLTISRVIPARTVTLRAAAVHKDWMKAEALQAARAGLRNPMKACQWCGHVFEPTEMVGIAICDNGNKALCVTCCDELLASAHRAENFDQAGDA